MLQFEQVRDVSEFFKTLSLFLGFQGKLLIVLVQVVLAIRLSSEAQGLTREANQRLTQRRKRYFVVRLIKSDDLLRLLPGIN